MADLISIDDNGTLTTTTGASDDVFFLKSPDATSWRVTVAAATGNMTWASGFTGTPLGRTELSATKKWGFKMSDAGSLSWAPVGLVSLTINAVDRKSLVLLETLSVEDQLNERNISSFEMFDSSGAFHPKVGQEVIVNWDFASGSEKIFAGTIDDFEEEERPGMKGRLWYRLACVDYNQFTDRHLVAKEYANQTQKQIVTDINTTHLAAEGVTVDPSMEDGPTIEQAVFNYRTVNEVFNDLSELTGFTWYIDYDKVLHFFSRTFFTAPFNLTADSDYRTLRYSKTRDRYRNKQFIRAGQDVAASRVQTFLGDGETQSWPLELPVSDEAPTIKVDAAAKTVGIRQIDSGKDFYYQSGSEIISQDSSGTKLTSSNTLEVTYKGLFPIIVQAQDQIAINERVTVEGGSGVYEAIQDEEEINRSALATDKASGLLRRFANIAEIIEFETDKTGLKAGQLLPVTRSSHNVDDSFLIESVQFRHIGAVVDTLRFQVKAMSGEPFGGFAEFFRLLAAQGRKFIIRDNEVLLLLRKFPETLAFAETSSAISAATVCGKVDDAVGFAEVCV